MPKKSTEIKDVVKKQPVKIKNLKLMKLKNDIDNNGNSESESDTEYETEYNTESTSDSSDNIDTSDSSKSDNKV